MPEGDSYARAAARLRPAIVGRPIEAVGGVAAIRSAADRLIGEHVTGIRTHGKHLLLDLSNDWTIHIWLGMPGRIRVRPFEGKSVTEGERRGAIDDPGAIRLLIETDSHQAICYSAPTIELERRRVIDRALRRLGPDVLAEAFDHESYRQRAALLPGDTMVADFLLDQRIMSGVGNEYKNEVLFLEHLHPERRLDSLDPATIDALADRARKLMLPNARRPGARNTTGYRGPDSESWVFERGGRPCHRCHTTIVSAHIGVRYPRITYWCPVCQPAERAGGREPDGSG
jgi:endonuclease-8